MNRYRLFAMLLVIAVVPALQLLPTCLSPCFAQPKAAELAAQPAKQSSAEPSDFVSMFDGKSLTGWLGDKPFWSVRDGVIVGEITKQTKIKRNRFLIYQGEIPADFEFIAEFRISANGNSGINYRSEIVPDVDFHALQGYQCDIDGPRNYVGSNYEERLRTTLASIGESVEIPELADSGELKHSKGNRWTVGVVQREIAPASELKEKMKDGEWNKVRITARGHVLRHYINGHLMSEVIDKDTANRRLQGRLGVQVHVGPPMTIEYRKLRVRKLSVQP